MTHKQVQEEDIFMRAVAKAVGAGYKPVKNLLGEMLVPTAKMLVVKNLYHAIIFSHDFAKAFWGEGKLDFMFSKNENVVYWWQHHLQQMVLEDEPLCYLEKFL